jgi:hypothetical protein
MVTVVKNPAGHKIIDQSIQAVITNSGGDALVTFAYHGLGTGDFVYIVSDIEDYNGFWYVTITDANSFKISEYDGADFVEYFQDLDIDYYQTTEHVWSSIFLPIVYKLSNNRWPINTVDTARTVSSSSDDNGYTQLTLSGALKSSFNALEYVEISGASDDDLNGVWQIVEKVTTSNIVIDLPYHTDNSFAGATVQYYYNNYQVKVKVYAGLEPTHPWAGQKPYTEVSELSFTPDENGIVMLSVSDYIQGKVAIKNNLLIFSYPLNLDAFTGFFIATAESYDVSDNYSLSTTESSFTADTYEGYAVAGKLPFKNVYSGDYSDYVFTSGSQALWLTAFSRLFAVEDLYFDVSFIKSIAGAFKVTVDKYISDYLTASEELLFDDNGIGVYRIPIEVSTVYTSYCIYATTIESPEVPGVESAITLPDLATGINTGTGISWTLGANPSVSLTATGVLEAVQSKRWTQNYPFIAGYTYEFTPDVDYNNDSITTDLHFYILDASDNILIDESTSLGIGTGSETTPITFVAPFGAVKYAYFFEFVNGFGSNTNIIDIDSITATETTPATPAVEALLITEEICIDIMQSCVADVEDGGTSDEDFFRLLETGFFRLLEDGERRLLEDAP